MNKNKPDFYADIPDWKFNKLIDELVALRDREIRDPNFYCSVFDGVDGITTGKKLLHDVYNAYAYGDTVKIVYIKRARRLEKPFEGFNWSYLDPPKRATPRKIGCEPYEPIMRLRTLDDVSKSENARFSQSISRTKSRVFELAACNEFQHFCTFTQDEKLRDRFDLSDFRKDFAQLVRNINRGRETKIKYLLIPEQHKNGAWHMHGLLSGLQSDDLRPFELSENIPERLKKMIRGGTAVYDWTRYRRAFGYFTCTEIESREACAKYVTKYISKDLQKTVREGGEHLFFASQGLKGRQTLIKNCADPCPVEKWDFENDFIRISEMPRATFEGLQNGGSK